MKDGAIMESFKPWDCLSHIL